MNPVNVICVGDSITFGSYIDEGGTPYPEQLLTLRGAGNTVTNAGHPSWTLAKMVTNFATDVTANLATDKQNIVILFAGTNDLYFSAALQSDPQPIIDDMIEYVGLAHGVGAKIFIATMIQRGSVSAGSMAGYWAARSTINTAILSSAVSVWGAEGVCDFAGTASQFETQFEGAGPVGWYTDTAHLTSAALTYLAIEADAQITEEIPMAGNIDGTIDAGLNACKTNAIRATVCSAEPANYAGIAAVALGVVTIASTDFTGPADDTSGRKLTFGGKTGVAISANGNVTFCAFHDNSSVLYATAPVTSQAVTSGQSWTLPTCKIAIADPA